MAVSMLVEKVPPWLTEVRPESGIALISQGSLARNLSDYPFPARCSEEEKRGVVERVLGALETLNLLDSGQYYSLEELTAREARFLAERRLITYEMLLAHGPRGVYVADDQRMCIMVNGADHVCLRVFRPGVQLTEVWAQLNLMDDTLSGVLDFAFHGRLGFLTSGLNMVGCALKTGVLLHLPGLVLTNRLTDQGDRVRAQHLTLRGVLAGTVRDGAEGAAGRRRQSGPVADEGSLDAGLEQALFSDVDGALACPVNETVGDLFFLVNDGTLGVSEEEVVYHVQHSAGEVLEEENRAREMLLENSPFGMEDRVGRARGIAGGARLLAFAEGLNVLSSLRLGASVRIKPGIRLDALNSLYLMAQAAHLEEERHQDYNAFTLNIVRAELFRRIVGGA